MRWLRRAGNRYWDEEIEKARYLLDYDSNYRGYFLHLFYKSTLGIYQFDNIRENIRARLRLQYK